MKRIAVYLTISHLAFTCGVGASSFWNWYKRPTPRINVVSYYTAKEPLSSPPVNASTPIKTPHREVVFGEGRLKIVTHQVHIQSERLRYKIDVSYPEILGTGDRHIHSLNRHIRKLVEDDYQWPMNPSKAELQYYKEKWPDVFNTIELDYEIRLATDSFLSIYFVGYSSGIGAGHPIQYSFTVNYDLTRRKELKLSDIFKRNSKYLEFIESYCKDELSKRPAGTYLFDDAFTRGAETFESWNVTSNGITFNFDECTVTASAAGEQAVEIPFSTLKPWLNPFRLPPY